jgi:phenylacetate-CoA ligase
MLFPFIRRKICYPLFYTLTGSPRVNYWKELERSQFFSQEVLRERQWLKLKSMVDYSYRYSPFYRDHFDGAGFHPAQLRSPADMAKIPVLTKAQIRENIKRMITAGHRPASLLMFKTGGSTGKPLELFISENCSEMRNALAIRHDRWSGWDLGEPVAAVWGNPELPVTIKDRLKNRLLEPFFYLDTMSVTDESVLAFARDWRKIRPTLLFGHAHSIYILAGYIRRLNIENIRPKGIICSSMMLLGHERKQIEDVFGVKVTNRYGCEEVSLIASECEMHSGMHLNIEHLFIEFIKDDGRCAEPGESGSIIVTDLINRAMPFIRYQVEDVGIPSGHNCPCGRGLPLMEHVAGRHADFLVKKDGTRVAGVSLIENTLTRIPGIDQMQIVQETLDLITLRLVTGNDFSAENKRRLLDYFADLFGPDTDIRFQLVDRIDPEKSGKYRFSICKLNYE